MLPRRDPSFVLRALLTRPATLAPALAALGLVLASCSSDPPGSSGTDPSSSSSTSSSASGGGGTGTGGAGGGCGGPASDCTAPVVPFDETPIAMDTLEATIVDLDGAPVEDLNVFACGTDICPPPGQTDANGHVLLNVAETIKRPAMKYGDGFLYGKFAALITDPKPVYASAVTPKLPTDGAPLDPCKEATSGGLTLTFAPGTSIEVDKLTYETPESRTLRAVEIPIAKAPAGLDPALNLEILYAVGPVDTLFCPSAAASVPNTPGWPAGTAVEFYVHGVSTLKEHTYAPYAGWGKISEGVVSADGKTVVTSEAGGLPILSAFGVRKK